MENDFCQSSSTRWFTGCILSSYFTTCHDRLAKLNKNSTEIAFKSIFIDQSELPPRIYNCLQGSNIHTLLDLLNNSQTDFMKMKHFRREDIKHILDILEIEKDFV